MNWFDLLGISGGLAMDAFAVAVAAGVTLGKVTSRQTFRLAFHFGLFQFLMPIFGWLAGKEIAVYFADYDHWVAFGLLAFVGGKMLLDAWYDKDKTDRSDPTRGLMLVALSVATSIDAMAVGMSMAFIRVSVWMPAIVIGLVAAVLSAFGITCGSRLGPRVGRWAEACGGCVLVLIGVRIVLSHVLV